MNNTNKVSPRRHRYLKEVKALTPLNSSQNIVVANNNNSTDFEKPVETIEKTKNKENVKNTHLKGQPEIEFATPGTLEKDTSAKSKFTPNKRNAIGTEHNSLNPFRSKRNVTDEKQLMMQSQNRNTMTEQKHLNGNKGIEERTTERHVKASPRSFQHPPVSQSHYDKRNNMFPTIHENKRLRNNDNLPMTKTVGVLNYTELKQSHERGRFPASLANNRNDMSRKNPGGNLSTGNEQYNSKLSPRKRGVETSIGAVAEQQIQNKNQSQIRNFADIKPNPGLQETTSNRNVPPATASSSSLSSHSLSLNTKLDILSKNRQLIYKETVWTRKRCDKLADTGFGDTDSIQKLKRFKEEKRWDYIMRIANTTPKMVEPIWQFLTNNYLDLFQVLNDEYKQVIRKFYQPKIANLQTTPGNANKMVEILMEQAQDYDKELYELSTTLQNQEKKLKIVHKVLNEAREAVYNWSGRELPEADQTEGNQVSADQEEESNGSEIDAISKEILDTFLITAKEKEQELQQLYEENGELKKKASRLTKALKAKSR